MSSFYLLAEISLESILLRELYLSNINPTTTVIVHSGQHKCINKPSVQEISRTYTASLTPLLTLG